MRRDSAEHIQSWLKWSTTSDNYAVITQKVLTVTQASCPKWCGRNCRRKSKNPHVFVTASCEPLETIRVLRTPLAPIPFAPGNALKGGGGDKKAFRQPHRDVQGAQNGFLF